MSEAWKSVLVGPSDTIRAAVSLMDAASLRTVLVIDEDQKLLGVLTDGDLRRAFLSNVQMDSPVSEIMNKNPFTINTSQTGNAAQAIMREKNLLCLPVVNGNKLCGLEIINQSTSRKILDNPVLLMAGGFGKRLHPLTENCPKPMLSVGGKPILHTILQSFIDAGFRNFFISTYYLADVIRDYFGDGSELGVEIRYLHEGKPLGTGGALSLLAGYSIDLPLIVCNGDVITDLNPRRLLEYHCKNNAVATICTREREYTVGYGVISTDGISVLQMVEKPTYCHQVNAGIYVIEPDVYGALEKNTKIDLPDLIAQFIASGSVITYPMSEFWIDVGQHSDFERAERMFSAKGDFRVD